MLDRLDRHTLDSDSLGPHVTVRIGSCTMHASWLACKHSWRKSPRRRLWNGRRCEGRIADNEMDDVSQWLPDTCLHTYLHTEQPTYLPTYQPTYIPTYQRTYIPTYIHYITVQYSTLHHITFTLHCIPLHYITIHHTTLNTDRHT